MERRIHGFALQNARRAGLERIALLPPCSRFEYRPKSVLRYAERIDDAADQFIAHFYGKNITGAAHGVADGDGKIIAEHESADGFFFQAERERRAFAVHGLDY